MRTIQLLSKNDEAVRTQITLTKKLKREVEKHAQKSGESLSEYLRKAAMIRVLVEDQSKEGLEQIVNRVIGSIDLKKHPVWKSKMGIYRWSRKIREER